MKSRKWVILAITLVVVMLFSAGVVAGGNQIVKGTGTRIIGVPLESQRPHMPWTLPDNPMGLDENNKANAPTPLMPVTWKEGFEYIWPNSTWQTFDNNGGVDLCWDDVSYRHFKGGWSGWPADGCADGYSPPGYDNDMDSWMTLGPFSTSGAKSGKVTFNYWLDTEPNWDYLWYCATYDYFGTWYCNNVSGWSNNKFLKATLDLKKVPGYGNMLGFSQVWVGWVFTSDGSYGGDVGYEGAYVDEINVTIK